MYTYIYFPSGSDGKEFACNTGDPGSIPGLERSPGEGNNYPVQYSCLENSMDRGALWAIYIYTYTPGAEWGERHKEKKNNRSDDSKTLSIAPSTKLALIIKCYCIKCLLLSLLLVIKTGPWELKNPTMKHNSDFRSDLHLMGPIVPTV